MFYQNRNIDPGMELWIAPKLLMANKVLGVGNRDINSLPSVIYGRVLFYKELQRAERDALGIDKDDKNSLHRLMADLAERIQKVMTDDKTQFWGLSHM